jgi:hypothetical protein
MLIGKAIHVIFQARLAKCYDGIPISKKKERIKSMWPTLAASVTLSKEVVKLGPGRIS